MWSARLVIAALVGCVCLGCAPPPPAGPGSAARSRYVALGDSFAAAPGVPEQAAPLRCHKSTNNYPAVLARRLRAATFRDVTCSGATTDDIYSRSQQTAQGPVDRQLDAVAPDTELITITVGANDVGLAGDAESCEATGANPSPCTGKFVVGDVDRISGLINAQIPVWAAMIDAVRTQAPRARIILVGYGLLMRAGGCYPEQPILPHDANYLQAKIDELGDRQRRLAAEKRIEYFDTRQLSAGHDMCAVPAERYVEGYVTRNRAVPLHPTALGAMTVGNVLTDYLVLSENR